MPESLRDRRLLSLDLGALVAGLGAEGGGYYALNVTDPDSTIMASQTSTMLFRPPPTASECLRRHAGAAAVAR